MKRTNLQEAFYYLREAEAKVRSLTAQLANERAANARLIAEVAGHRVQRLAA